MSESDDAVRTIVQTQYDRVCAPAMERFTEAAKANALSIAELRGGLLRVEVGLTTVLEQQAVNGVALHKLLDGNGGDPLIVRLSTAEREVESLVKAREAFRSGVRSMLSGMVMRIISALILFLAALFGSTIIVRENNMRIKEEVLNAIQQIVPTTIAPSASD